MARRVQTMVQLTEDLLSMLDRRAAAEGISRSQVIRDAVDAYLDADRRSVIDAQIVDAYTRMPQGGRFDVDEWGDLGAFVTALSVETFKRLDEEERESGADPW